MLHLVNYFAVNSYDVHRIVYVIRIGPSLIRYIFAEVSHGYLLEEDEQLYSEKQRRVSTFMKTPRELEKV